MAQAETKFEIPQGPYQQLDYWRSRKQRRPEEFVYLLQASGDTPIKIGKARDVYDRIASLQTGNPRRIELQALVVGGEELERAWHYELRRSRLVGEWFDGPEIVAFIEQVRAVALEMLAAYQATSVIPDYREFVKFKERKRTTKRKPAPVKTTFVAPQPSSAEEVQRNLWRREKERAHRVKMPDDFTYPTDP